MKNLGTRADHKKMNCVAAEALLAKQAQIFREFFSGDPA
jgi:hypothetical protein